MKNLILIVVIIAALGGAVYLITQGGPKSGASEQEQAQRHFVDPATLGSDMPAGVSMTVADFRSRAGAGDPVVAPNGSIDLVPAGVCPTDGKYYALVGHGEVPESCPHCGTSLSGYSVDGNPL